MEGACLDDTFKWWMHTIKVEGLEYFVFKIFNNHHDCLFLRDVEYQQVSSKLIGDYIKLKCIGIAHQYKLKEIQFDL